MDLSKNRNKSSVFLKGEMEKKVQYNEKVIMNLNDELRQPSDIVDKLENLELEAKEMYEVSQDKFNSNLKKNYSKFKILDENLSKFKANLLTFKDLKSKNIKILEDFTQLIKGNKTISSVCLAQQRFSKIKEFLEKFENIDDYNPVNDDILIYYDNVYEYEEFACEIMMYNVELSSRDNELVDYVLKEIKKKSVDFTLILMDLVKDYKENYKIISSVNEIIQKEEKRDKIINDTLEGEKGKNPVKMKIAEMYPSYLSRQPKNLKNSLIKVIESSIAEKFNIQGSSFILSLDFVLDDLTFVKEKIKLDFFTFSDFLVCYHYNLKFGIDRNLPKMDAGEILRLIEFKLDYYTTMSARFNKVAESLGPRLIDGENELLEKYAKTASSKLQGWIENITTKEIERFRSRDKDISRDENGKLISAGFINLLQLIKTQLEPVSFNKKVFLYISKTVYSHCDDFREKISGEIESDFLSTCKGTSKEGFEDYCIIFGNSGLKLTQYITSLPQCQSEEIRELGNIFISILKTSNYFLSEFILFTCKPAIKNFFIAKWETHFKTFLITLEDFLNDYIEAMCDFSFNTLCHELCDCIVSSYFKRLNSKDIIINDQSGDIMRSNYNKILEVFDKFTSSEDLEVDLSPLLKLIPLFKAINIDILTLEIKSLIMTNDSVSKSMIVNIISRRNNILAKTKEEILSGIPKIVQQCKKQKRNFMSYE